MDQQLHLSCGGEGKVADIRSGIEHHPYAPAIELAVQHRCAGHQFCLEFRDLLDFAGGANVGDDAKQRDYR
jgi:hypothetical protein